MAGQWPDEPDDEPAQPGGIVGWFDERTRIRPVIAALLHVRIPIEAKTYYLGGITLMLFGVQVVTGTLMTLYYQPTADTAYDSVKMITSDVTFGWLIRSVHKWGADLMIFFLALHLVRIFYQGAYKYPRELIWIIGGGLLLVTIGFGFTGYLLPWDQKAFWATTVGTEIAGSVPVIGESLLVLLRGGMDVTGATLGRFFGIHVLVLPASLIGLLVLHLTLVHQLGLANPKRPEPRPVRQKATRTRVTMAPAATGVTADARSLALATAGAGAMPASLPPGSTVAREPASAASMSRAIATGMAGGTDATEMTDVADVTAADPVVASAEATATPVESPQSVQGAPVERLKPFFPNYILDELIAWYVVLAVLVILASVFPAGLEPKANPLETPPHIKPEWYFLSLYELLKLVPRIVGVVGPVIAIGVLVLWPLLDRNPEVRMRRRLLAVGGMTVILVGIVGLTVYGLVS